MAFRRWLLATTLSVALVPSGAAAGAAVTFTDFDSRPAVRPVVIDASSTVRAGPFTRWRGWGRPTTRAAVSRGRLRTTVTLSQIRRCGGRRQYRRLVIRSYENGRRSGPVRRFTNRSCRR
jgi:hypothetical protein